MKEKKRREKKRTNRISILYEQSFGFQACINSNRQEVWDPETYQWTQRTGKASHNRNPKPSQTLSTQISLKTGFHINSVARNWVNSASSFFFLPMVSFQLALSFSFSYFFFVNFIWCYLSLKRCKFVSQITLDFNHHFQWFSIELRNPKFAHCNWIFLH